MTEEHIKDSRQFKLMERMERGERLTVADIAPLFDELWHGETYRTASSRVGGWYFSFQPYLKRFLVRMKHEGWKEIYSINKTAIRKLAWRPSWILEIVEVKPSRKVA